MAIKVKIMILYIKDIKHSKKHSLGIYEHIELLNFLKYLKNKRSIIMKKLYYVDILLAVQLVYLHHLDMNI